MKAGASTIAGASTDKAKINRPIKDKWALVIGISEFQDTSINLKYAAKDARDFAQFLVKECKFAPDHVRLLINKNATRENILAEIGDKWLPRVANPDDLVLIFVSSHGSPSKVDLNGVNYLVAHNTDKNSLYATGVPMQDLMRMIKDRVHSDRVVLMIDPEFLGIEALRQRCLHISPHECPQAKRRHGETGRRLQVPAR
ncbi:MAG: caspase family protein [Candidatus Obscuribacter sp.]|nr:caspase family protein [Candidatus Obscuribacter sp.]